ALIGLLVVERIVRTGCLCVLLRLLREPRYRDDPLAFADLEDHHALAAPARDANIVHRAADHHPAISYQHDLIVVPDREDRDDGIARPPPDHVVDPLPAAPGDPVIIRRGPDAVAFLGHAEHEFLAL